MARVVAMYPMTWWQDSFLQAQEHEAPCDVHDGEPLASCSYPTNIVWQWTCYCIGRCCFCDCQLSIHFLASLGYFAYNHFSIDPDLAINPCNDRSGHVSWSSLILVDTIPSLTRACVWTFLCCP